MPTRSAVRERFCPVTPQPVAPTPGELLRMFIEGLRPLHAENRNAFSRQIVKYFATTPLALVTAHLAWIQRKSCNFSTVIASTDAIFGFKYPGLTSGIAEFRPAQWYTDLDGSQFYVIQWGHGVLVPGFHARRHPDQFPKNYPLDQLFEYIYWAWHPDAVYRTVPVRRAVPRPSGALLIFMKFFSLLTLDIFIR